jgi:hypothetical protein
MVPSSDKWGIFKYSCLYCQQLLDIEEKEPGKSEIPVPKPRLLSPETKSGRGDEDTNPAYGKARQFARETQWAEFVEINQCMVLLFLRNMRMFIEQRPEVFVPREWGGLGLPGIPPKCIYRMLPPWHQQLVTHREMGSSVARRLLSNWATPRIMHRGFAEADVSPYEDLLLEFLPTASVNDLGIDFPPKLRHREKLKMAKKQGWIPLTDVMFTMSESTTYADIWDVKAVSSRGFSTVPWIDRTERLKAVSDGLPGLLLREAPDGPSWQPGPLVLVHNAFGIFESESESSQEEYEEGELRQLVFPFLGSFCSPRVFLHYDNNRLILHATSR